MESQNLSVEDVTVMKLMEEIVEIDSEIKLKQKWINTRIKLLHQIQTQNKTEPKGQLINEFLSKIQPEYPQKLSVEYKGPASEPIPLSMKNVYDKPVALGMKEKHEVIPLAENEEGLGLSGDGKQMENQD
mmetsp:Transcript_4580/g.6950  ORF Transcript_4580/g.6950 Transcript_4580/m.6950 type:complete len:130 (-) Transcript_4580:42-431(-)|eukprot:CAMPEP_0170491178 /NCGR_PEP_ID=MMETSP0208-20121228/10528_1 /TAXON_ID=197538 /ORGANISM="Strombidium inclinatum, Strain S3" /LENGTH=129 /DNA_ID=CAMNT_0010766709 /DNA_START=23 /DNA_END=412 /DNA_ORIENTATION=-